MSSESTQPLLLNPQGDYYGTTLSALAHQPRGVCVLEMESRDSRIFKAWTVFRNICKFLDPKKHLPSLLSVTIRRPERINTSTAKRLIVDHFLREKMDKRNEEEIYEILIKPSSLIGKEEEHIFQIIREYFPSLEDLLSDEKKDLWLELRRMSQNLVSDENGELTYEAVTNLQKHVALMLRLSRAVPRADPRAKMSESMIREMNTLRDHAGQMLSRLRDTEKSDRMRTAQGRGALHKTVFTEESLNPEQASHLIKCTVLYDRMIKAIQERPFRV